MRHTLIRSAAVILPLLMASGAYAQRGTAPASTVTPGAVPPTNSTVAPPVAVTSGAVASTASAANLSKVDKEFITKAAQGGAAEVAMAQLAQQKSQDDGVKKFAQAMIDDHTPANKKLADTAAAKGITAPTDPSAGQQKMMAKLQTLDGTKFDHAYLTGQVKAHEAMLKLFQRESTNGKDADLKSFADTTTPVIQKHITMAQNTK